VKTPAAAQGVMLAIRAMSRRPDLRMPAGTPATVKPRTGAMIVSTALIA